MFEPLHGSDVGQQVRRTARAKIAKLLPCTTNVAKPVRMPNASASCLVSCSVSSSQRLQGGELNQWCDATCHEMPHSVYKEVR